MNPWHKLPFLRLILPLFCGILLGIKALIIIPQALILGVLLLFIQYLLLLFYKKILSYSQRWVTGVFINMFLFCCGWCWGYYQYLPHNQDFYGNYCKNSNKQYWLVRISGPLSQKEKSIKAIGKISYLLDHEHYTRVSGKMYLNFDKNSKANLLSDGDLVLIHAYLNSIQGPSFPLSFDYASFSAHKGIFHQTFLKQKDWKLIQKKPSFSLRSIAWQWQQKLVAIIREQSMGKDEQAVGCAMLLGYTEGFGQELQGAYSRAGVTHILSVSGLHVGLVFAIFSKLLFFMNKTRSQKILKTILLILLTWLYAFLTGLAPCVQRAGFMFTFLIVGQNLKRKNNIVNTLFASAFILLLINPSNIYDYGFQLSYLAVLGIVILEPILYSMLYIKNLWIDKIWKLTAVTLAAQIATAPLAIFHFHMFPSWFIPANLIVIPLSTLVMYLGICLLATSQILVPGDLFRLGFGYSIRLMNDIISLTDKLPFNVIEGLFPSAWNTIFCFLCIFCLTAWAISSRKIFAFLSLVCILFYAASLSFNAIQNRKKEYLFFCSNKQDWFGISNPPELLLYSGKNGLPDSNTIKQKLRPYLLKKNIKSILFYTDTIFYKNTPSLVNGKNTFLWVHQKTDPSTLLSNHKQAVILGGNLPYKYRDAWKSFCISQKILYVDIKNNGCFLSEQ